MPIYDVQCLKCSNISELFLKNINEKLKCPICGNEEVKKLISATSSITGKSSILNPISTCCGSTPDKTNCEGAGSCCSNV